MQSSIIKKTETYLGDVNFHLENLRLGIETLQLDYNKEKPIYLFCNVAIEQLSLIDNLLNKTNLATPIIIATEVNELFSIDDNLSIVNMQFINSKRLFNPSGIAYLKITL
ncbi:MULTISPECIES: hypothetical protein [unclassified Flavobacterium]|uniref:hypothetical protein n=1 Tax=unclassified Flavobacterium TaxID=196869 RepID=UPI001290B909|nr:MULTISPECIES: hypothetical protein [unclassified Flavobacterium]MQP52698.1 hypothetical protein [Flavobacterium sp. LMO9]MQP62122.1 hypothetical protein [Flavobacterium sp. LMO6]